MIKKFLADRTFLLFLILFIPGFLAFFLFPFLSKKTTQPQSNSENYALSVMEMCHAFQDKDSCYSTKILNLTKPPKNLSMGEAFNLLKQVQEKDPGYAYCHTLAHELGAQEVAKDPANWKDVVAKCPSMLCSGGCSHGALTEKFKAETLTDNQIDEFKLELVSACEPRENWQPKAIDIYNCTHGIGHLGMFLTNANINKSLEICREIGSHFNRQDYEENCTSGIFMQIFQPLEPEDSILIEKIAPEKNSGSVEKFCSQFSDIPYHACHRESWPYFFSTIQTPGGFISFCNYTSDEKYQVKCYQILMNAVANQFGFRENNFSKLADFCAKLDSKFQYICYTQSITRILNTSTNLMDKALFMCREAENSSEENGEKCRNYLFRFAINTYSKNSEEYNNYCSKLPDNLKLECLNQN